MLTKGHPLWDFLCFFFFILIASNLIPLSCFLCCTIDHNLQTVDAFLACAQKEEKKSTKKWIVYSKPFITKIQFMLTSLIRLEFILFLIKFFMIFITSRNGELIKKPKDRVRANFLVPYIFIRYLNFIMHGILFILHQKLLNEASKVDSPLSTCICI